MDYTEVRFYNDASLNEILIAWLGENDFDMFEERPDGINAYIISKNFSEKNLSEIILNIPDSAKNIRYETALIKDQNWNTRWESNFEPVSVLDQVYIRAPFHPQNNQHRFEIVIEPKMSFGTGHHSTTVSMIKLMLGIEMTGKSILDMGCGTGILAILSAKLGANQIKAIDIEEWAFENCKENCQRNDAEFINVQRGDAGLLQGMKFDIILANINRNILLNDIPKYVKSLIKNGHLLLSGILISDKEILNNCAEANGLIYEREVIDNNWIALQYKNNR
jgi:ribosomal protein L11 methyltransferase